MIWNIYTYGGIDLYQRVFNAIVIIFGQDDYTQGLALSALIGFIGILIQSAFAGDMRKMNVQWILITMAVYLALLTPKVTVDIRDQTRGPLSHALVDNVPIGLAMITSIPSQFKKYFTEIFETVFTLPNGMGYTTGGLGIGLSIVEKTANARIEDPQLRMELQRFFEECVLMDIAIGLYSWWYSSQSNYLDNELEDKISKASYYEYPYKSNEYMSCRRAYSTGILPLLRVEEQRLNTNMARSVWGIHGKETANVNTLLSEFYITADSAAIMMQQEASGQADRLIENILGNALRESIVISGSNISEAYVLEKSKAERLSTMRAMGVIGKEMLPIMQHVFEVIVFAIFPLIALIFVTPVGGKAILAYAKAIIWLALWSPLFVIVNYVSAYYASLAMAGVTQDRMLLNTATVSVMNEYASVAGYLAASIPMIAWMLVQQSGAMMAGLAGRTIQSYEGTASRAADEASSGNIQAGNVGIGNTTMWQTNMSPSTAMGSSIWDGGGFKETAFTNSNGETQSILEQKQDSTVLSGSVSKGISDAVKADYKEDINAATESSVLFLQGYSEQLTTQKQGLEKLSEQLETTLQNSRGSEAGRDQNYQAARQAKDQLDEQIAVIDQQQEQISLGLGASADGKSALGAAAGLLGIKAGMGVTGAEMEMDKIGETFSFTAQQTVQDSVKVAEKAQEVLQTSDKSGLSNESIDSITSASGEVDQLQTQWKSTIRQGEAASLALSQMEEGGSKVSIDNEGRILEALKESGQERAILSILQKDGYDDLSEGQKEILNKAIDDVQATDMANKGFINNENFGKRSEEMYEEKSDEVEIKGIQNETNVMNTANVELANAQESNNSEVVAETSGQVKTQEEIEAEAVKVKSISQEALVGTDNLAPDKTRRSDDNELMTKIVKNTEEAAVYANNREITMNIERGVPGEKPNISSEDELDKPRWNNENTPRTGKDS